MNIEKIDAGSQYSLALTQFGQVNSLYISYQSLVIHNMVDSRFMCGGVVIASAWRQRLSRFLHCWNLLQTRILLISQQETVTVLL